MKTIGEFKSLFDLLQAFPTEESCIEYLEKELWNGTPVSPYDPTSKVYCRGDGMYRCKNTGKNFDIRIATLFEGSKISLRKWFYAVYMVTRHTKGISLCNYLRTITLHRKQLGLWRTAYVKPSSRTTKKSLTVRLNLMKHSLVARTKTAIRIRKRRNAKAEHSLIKFP